MCVYEKGAHRAEHTEQQQREKKNTKTLLYNFRRHTQFDFINETKHENENRAKNDKRLRYPKWNGTRLLTLSCNNKLRNQFLNGIKNRQLTSEHHIARCQCQCQCQCLSICILYVCFLRSNMTRTESTRTQHGEKERKMQCQNKVNFTHQNDLKGPNDERLLGAQLPQLIYACVIVCFCKTEYKFSIWNWFEDSSFVRLYLGFVTKCVSTPPSSLQALRTRETEREREGKRQKTRQASSNEQANQRETWSWYLSRSWQNLLSLPSPFLCVCVCVYARDCMMSNSLSPSLCPNFNHICCANIDRVACMFN